MVDVAARFNSWSDEDIREEIKKIDSDPSVDMKDWDIDFIESAIFEYDGPLSKKQRAQAERIIEEYGQKS